MRSAVVLAVTLAAISGCSRTPAKPPVKSGPARPPVVVRVEGADTVQSDEQGNKLWRVKADEMLLNQEKGTAELTGGQITVYGPNDTIRLNLIAPHVRTDVFERKLTAWGGIKADSPSTQTRFSARKIELDVNRNSIVASEGLSGSRPNGSFEAAKLESDLKVTWMRLSDPEMVRILIDFTNERTDKP